MFRHREGGRFRKKVPRHAAGVVVGISYLDYIIARNDDNQTSLELKPNAIIRNQTFLGISYYDNLE